MRSGTLLHPFWVFVLKESESRAIRMYLVVRPEKSNDNIPLKQPIYREAY
jgi:hypothetical protein